MSPSETQPLTQPLSAPFVTSDQACPSSAALSPPRLVLRLDLGERVMLEPSKVRLLELIDETGSISAAGRIMGISYRYAWSLVEELNATFPTPLVEARCGGSGGGGASLLALGTEIVGIYRALERDAASAGALGLKRLQAALSPPA